MYNIFDSARRVMPFSSSWIEVIILLITGISLFFYFYHRHTDKVDSDIKSVIDSYLLFQFDRAGYLVDFIGLRRAGITRLKTVEAIHKVINELIERKSVSSNIGNLKDTIFKLNHDQIIFVFENIVNADKSHYEQIIKKASEINKGYSVRS